MIAELQRETFDVRAAISAARVAQASWTLRSIRERAKLIGALRPLLAQHADEFARVTAAIGQRPVAEKMVSEVLPLLEACRFLEKNAARILRTKRFARRGRPLWLYGSTFDVQRKPFGVVLIVGPANYPFFIPLVQMLHALAAGNAVALKPAAQTGHLLARFLTRVIDASEIPRELIQILPEQIEAAREAARSGIDKAIFTGSSENGRSFLRDLAAQNIPSVMELSGADQVFVRADADLALAARAIAFGSRLNGGNTCMAPHAIIAHEKIAAPLARALRELGLPGTGMISVRDDVQALEIAALDSHGLGASIFSRDEKAARRMADRLTTGFVTINDMIVPTADPRFPFTATRGSGFGATRGAEGLLELTFPQTIAVRRVRFLPHLDSPQENDAELFASFVSLTHARGLKKRLRAFGKMLRLGRQRAR